MSDYTKLIEWLRADVLCTYEETKHMQGLAADAIEALQRACANYAEQAEELQVAVDGYEANTDVQFVEHGTYSELKFVPKWIPVTERLPENNTRVIGFMAWKAMAAVERQHNRWYSIDHLEPLPDEAVTHWMPLPQPPKVDEA